MVQTSGTVIPGRENSDSKDIKEGTSSLCLRSGKKARWLVGEVGQVCRSGSGRVWWDGQGIQWIQGMREAMGGCDTVQT